ncbi:tetratricopeptide repeat protein [Marinobacterium rhizophilum]|uniref:Sel1 repeat family protein n=1 Tax=Marinobacterium rhizophilum TaxID=420402 RepID=A0ABY5HHS2_9GAMM|nr:sel1 repeat family protein [Marinobacterium rhizophilum]UTW11910.1 sel1 repeat family protein [Marinobacterium rhizophilum]
MRLILKILAPLVFWLAYGLFRLRLFRSSRRRHRWAMKLFRLAAEQGHRKALSVYGHLLHFRGEGITNRIQGAIYLQLAADKGDSKACYQMGRVFENGFEHHFPQDPARSLHYYRQAAEQQHPLALRRLADACRHGELGQAPDSQEAERWEQQLNGAR